MASVKKRKNERVARTEQVDKANVDNEQQR